MQKMEKPSMEKIEKLIYDITFIQECILEKGKKTKNSIHAAQNNHMLEIFKNVLYFAWESYNYGKHPNLKEECDSIYDYILVELHILEVIKVLIIILKKNSPFLSFSNGDALTDELLQVYNDLQEKLIRGEIKL